MLVIKTIKFDLPIDGVKVKNLEELRDHFTVEILEHYYNGLLAKWLKSRNLNEELTALEAIHTEDHFTLMQQLCEVFKIDADEMIIASALGMPPEKMEQNFPEIKRQYRAIARKEEKDIWLKEEERRPIKVGDYFVYKSGIVKDPKTKLMWKRESEGKYTWDDAMQ